MQIRPETASDYPVIAEVNIKAFGERLAEALIVALHRHRSAFDPDLSLVAEIEGQVVGHVLFTPHKVQILGQSLSAVNLAPIAIDPAYQKQGIGGRLIEEGHRLAREKGYAFSFLLGHPSYYPRFGYLTNAYGGSSLKLPLAGLPVPTLHTRALQAEDVDALHALWQQLEAAVDMALDPGKELLEWLSPNPQIEARAYTDEIGNIVGYTRIHAAERAKPRAFLARDSQTALQMAATIAPGLESTLLQLPLHPASPVAQGLGEARASAWEPAMVCPLQPSPFDEYYTELKAGKRLPGRPIWPTAFDLE